jgi:hypothetical protein
LAPVALGKRLFSNASSKATFLGEDVPTIGAEYVSKIEEVD